MKRINVRTEAVEAWLRYPRSQDGPFVTAAQSTLPHNCPGYFCPKMWIWCYLEFLEETRTIENGSSRPHGPDQDVDQQLFRGSKQFASAPPTASRYPHSHLTQGLRGTVRRWRPRLPPKKKKKKSHTHTKSIEASVKFVA